MVLLQRTQTSLWIYSGIAQLSRGTDVFVSIPECIVLHAKQEAKTNCACISGVSWLQHITHYVCTLKADACNTALMVCMLYETHTINTWLLVHILFKLHILKPLFIVNVLCKTQNSKPELIVHFVWEDHMYIPELLNHVFCDRNHYYKPSALKVIMHCECILDLQSSNGEFICLYVPYKVYAYKSAHTVNVFRKHTS